MTVDLDADGFEALVGEVLDALPAEMVDGLENVALLVEDAPGDGVDLLGRYEGVDLTRRGTYGFGELPDRIVLYRLPHLAAADSLDQLSAEVRVTLVHEIGHWYGLDDARLHDLGWA